MDYVSDKISKLDLAQLYVYYKNVFYITGYKLPQY